VALDPLNLFKLLSGGDLAASADKSIGRTDSEGRIDWEQTPFRDLELIGRGGMGAVFRAHDTRADRPVALKLLLSSTPAARERFRREGRLAASLSHPNVVQVHDLLEYPKGDLLVCELLTDAQPLDRAWQGLGLERRVEMLRDASCGVAAAHALGIVHRDLKPDNVLVAEGRTQIADFGVAYGEDLERMTMSGTTVGTPTFMAPEQLRVSRSAAPTASADSWSLGVMLYLALTDELPFRGESVLQLAAALGLGYGSEQERALRGAPAPLASLVRDCLEPEPERRPADAAQFQRRLDAWLANPVGSSGPRSSPWALVLGALLVALVGGIFFARRTEPPPASPTPSALGAETPAPTPGSQSELQRRRRGLVEEALLTLKKPDDSSLTKPLTRLLELSRELPPPERGVLEGRVLEELASQVAKRRAISAPDRQALAILADLGARVRSADGIVLVGAYISQRSFDRLDGRVQQSLFLTLLRLDVPTDYLSVDQFTHAFGPLGAPAGSTPWERYARLRTLVTVPRQRELLLALVREPPPGLRLGPTQEAEAISEVDRHLPEGDLRPDLERVIRRAPRSVPALFRLSSAHGRRGDLQRSAATLERGLKALHANSYSNLGISRSYAGRMIHYAAGTFARLEDQDRARELVAEGANYPLTPTRTGLLKKHPELRD